MEIVKFSKYNLNENLDDEIKDKLSDRYKSLKRGVVALAEENLTEKDELVGLQNLLSSIRDKGIDTIKLSGFIEDADIRNFYLKYQSDIDELLKDEKYFDIKPNSNSIFSLNDFVIDGTKKAVEFVVELIEKDLF